MMADGYKQRITAFFTYLWYLTLLAADAATKNQSLVHVYGQTNGPTGVAVNVVIDGSPTV